MLWIVRSAVRPFYPRTETLPGVEDTGLSEFLRELKRTSPMIMWTALVASSIVFIMSPILTLGIPLPTWLLSPALLDRHASRAAYHRIYLLRQAVLAVKVAGGLCWGADPNVRAQMALPPYPGDPGTFRSS